ncbi:VanW family protein [Syntrophobotulus glycolicus]|nr:VanW family protein [Syntrophobotulus glycolicus]
MKPIYPSKEPVNRSKLRLFMGKLFFSWRRYFQWYFAGSACYAATFQTSQLPFKVAEHQTPLYRPLRNVDMWLQENKVINLKLAAEKINGLVLKPGETFSFWRLVGKPTRAKGFTEGMVLNNGSFVPGIGGGLCQLSNLIYWMTLHTPLQVKERWRHTHDVFPDAERTQPFGSGATVVYNYIDLQITNETQYSYQLQIRVGVRCLEGEWRSEQPFTHTYEVYQSDHLITQEWWGGYLRHNVISRRVFDLENNPVGDEIITENHAMMMYEPMLPGDGSVG